MRFDFSLVVSFLKHILLPRHDLDTSDHISVFFSLLNRFKMPLVVYLTYIAWPDIEVN